MSKSPIPVRFDEEESRAIKQFADTHCAGNFSRAVRALCASALESYSAQTIFEIRLEMMLKSAIERMIKIQSRGTKTAFANLALSSMFLPAIAESLRVIGEAAIDDKEGRAKEYFQEELDSALYSIGKIAGCSQNAVFNKAWEYGGRLQAQSGTPSLYEATKKGGQSDVF